MTGLAELVRAWFGRRALTPPAAVSATGIAPPTEDAADRYFRQAQHRAAAHADAQRRQFHTTASRSRSHTERTPKDGGW